jgi:hypothetical protein
MMISNPLVRGFLGFRIHFLNHSPFMISMSVTYWSFLTMIRYPFNDGLRFRVYLLGHTLSMMSILIGPSQMMISNPVNVGLGFRVYLLDCPPFDACHAKDFLGDCKVR